MKCADSKHVDVGDMFWPEEERASDSSISHQGHQDGVLQDHRKFLNAVVSVTGSEHMYVCASRVCVCVTMSV